MTFIKGSERLHNERRMSNNYFKEIIVKSILSIFIYHIYFPIKNGNPMKNEVLTFFRFNRLETIGSSNR